MDAIDIKIVAEFLPGDESIRYTSPYAGGNFSCITGDDAATLRRDKNTYQNLFKVQKSLGGAKCGLDRYVSHEYFATYPSQEKIDSYKSYLDDYEELKDLPEGYKYGIRFLSWNFNCPLFLKSMMNYLHEKGVEISRKKLNHITEAYDSDTIAVVNCSGIGAKSLGGVEDSAVYPTRGQVVVVKAPHIRENRMFWGEDSATYVIKRPYSNDQLILGGFLQHGDWTSDTLKEQTDDILERTTKRFPKILSENPHGPNIEVLEILRVVAGLRPSRNGGVRIEKQNFQNKILVHNYGASGYGYQAGFGMGQEAAKLALATPRL